MKCTVLLLSCFVSLGLAWPMPQYQAWNNPQNQWNMPQQQSWNMPQKQSWNMPQKQSWNMPQKQSWNMPQKQSWNMPQQQSWNMPQNQAGNMPQYQQTSQKLFILDGKSMNTMTFGNGNSQTQQNNMQVTAVGQQITVVDGGRTFTTNANGKNVILLKGANYHVLGSGIHFANFDRQLKPAEEQQVEAYKSVCEQKMQEWQVKFKQAMAEWQKKFNEWMQTGGYMSGKPAPQVKNPPSPQFPAPPQFYP